MTVSNFQSDAFHQLANFLFNFHRILITQPFTWTNQCDRTAQNIEFINLWFYFIYENIPTTTLLKSKCLIITFIHPWFSIYIWMKLRYTNSNAWYDAMRLDSMKSVKLSFCWLVYIYSFVANEIGFKSIWWRTYELLLLLLLFISLFMIFCVNE